MIMPQRWVRIPVSKFKIQDVILIETNFIGAFFGIKFKLASPFIQNHPSPSQTHCYLTSHVQDVNYFVTLCAMVLTFDSEDEIVKS